MVPADLIAAIAQVIAVALGGDRFNRCPRQEGGDGSAEDLDNFVVVGLQRRFAFCKRHDRVDQKSRDADVEDGQDTDYLHAGLLRVEPDLLARLAQRGGLGDASPRSMAPPGRLI